MALSQDRRYQHETLRSTLAFPAPAEAQILDVGISGEVTALATAPDVCWVAESNERMHGGT